MKDRVLIIDALNFIYRGVITFKNNTIDASKQDYTIVYNFFRNLRALIEVLEPTKCFMALEGNPTFRKTLFSDYKKNRLIKRGSKQAEIKTNVLRQADIIYQLASHLPITLIRAEEYEADDTIYTLANNLKDEEVILISSDSDLIQILQILHKHDVKLFHPGKKQFIEPPDHVYLVWKSLAGDASDNIPAITSKNKAEHLANTPDELQQFLSIEENRADFNLNKQLIELQLIQDSKLHFQDYIVNFNSLFLSFETMQLPSLLEENYKSRFIDTFKQLI